MLQQIQKVNQEVIRCGVQEIWFLGNSGSNLRNEERNISIDESKISSVGILFWDMMVTTKRENTKQICLTELQINFVDSLWGPLSMEWGVALF